MATEGFKRKLAAILSADVAGYSRLMGEDEAATVRSLETYRRVVSDLIQQHRGRVVDSPGDRGLEITLTWGRAIPEASGFRLRPRPEGGPGW